MEREDQSSEYPTALIYGVPLDGNSWAKRQAELLAAGYRAISVDRRGFEWSKGPVPGYGYDDFATDLNTLLERLGLDDCVLCEFSMGSGEVARRWGGHGSDCVVSDRYVHFNFFFDDFYNVDILVPERVSRQASIGRAGEDLIQPFEAAAGRLPGVIGDLYLVEVEGGPHDIGRPHSQEYNDVLLGFLNGSGPIIGGKARSAAGSAR